jgi:tetraacyldisaccharide-1-P 4'-kinase
VVASDDSIEDVGDEALVCARALGNRAPVVVAPSRQAALDLAALARPDAIIVDGPLQTRPVRAALAILAVDAEEPWGSGATFPAGDLRARPSDLIAASDLVVPVDATPAAFLIDGERLAPEKLRGLRIGLFTAIARPSRLVRALGRLGLSLSATVEVPDHGPLDAPSRAVLRNAPVDVWIATPKCGVHLEGVSLSAPLVVASRAVALPDAWERRLHGRGDRPVT